MDDGVLTPRTLQSTGRQAQHVFRQHAAGSQKWGPLP